MAEDGPIFPAEEYERRCAALKREMDRHGLDALLLTSAADVFYVTGFLTRFWESPARPWFVLLPLSGGPFAVVPEIGRDLMSRCRVAEIRSWDSPDPDDEGVSLLADVLTALVPERGVVGVPMGAETSLRMPLSDFRRVRDAIAPRQFADATEAVRRVREIKSGREIEKLRTICGIADAAFDRLPEILRGAPRFGDAARRFQMALLEEGADWVSYLAGGIGPDGYGSVIAPPGGASIGEGDVVMLDTGAVRDGYFCDIDRNYAIGTASDDMRRAYRALHEATEALLSGLGPGMAAREGHALIAGALARAGAADAGGRLGHGIGVTLTDWPSFAPGDGTILREGMVLTVEPAVVLPSGNVMVQEEDFVLGARGPELLSRRAPADLPVVPP